MPLRFLSAVAAIHLFPFIHDNFIKSEYLKDSVPYPSWSDFCIFVTLCVLAVFFSDSQPVKAEYDKSSALIGTTASNPEEAKRAETASPSANGNNIPKPSEQAVYTTRGLNKGSTRKHNTRQLLYDISVYCIPLVAVAITLPLLRPIVDFVLVFVTFYMPLYNKAVSMLFLKSTSTESLEKAAFRLKSYPHADQVANGWYRLANTAELAPGQVMYIQALGEHFALFRGQDGRVRCLDAFCVHMGANMAVEGKVVDNCLQCPFHHWSFNGEGKCTRIPYQDKVPAQTSTKAYHVHEYYGMILVWYCNGSDAASSSSSGGASNGHSSGNASCNGANSGSASGHKDSEHSCAHSATSTTTNGHSATATTCSNGSLGGMPPAPLYYPPELDVLSDGSSVHRGRRDLSVNMHLREFAENSTDFAHFGPLHGRMTFPFTPIDMPGITVNHTPDWQAGSGKIAHMAWFTDEADLNILGVRREWTHAKAVITMIGPAGVVFFRFDTPLGSIVLFQTHTPVTPLRLDTQFSWFATATMPRILVWYIVGNWVAQWQNDISVWENKLYAGKPVLVKGDGPMMKQRRWYSQFYTQKLSVSDW